MIKAVRILGYLSVFFGAAATILCFFPYGIYYGIMAGLPGFICSSAFIVLNERHQVFKKRITPGLIGLVLNSVPLIIVLVFMLMYSEK